MTLFHNHIGDSFRISYPLIQYKTICGKAALFAIGEGTREIERFLSKANLEVTIGKRKEVLSVDNVWANYWLLQTWDDVFRYHIRSWLPLNQKNYEVYSNTEGIIERTHLLENVLTGNILSMSKGLKHYYESPVLCTITAIHREQLYIHKGIRMQGFDISFKSNVFLPDFIGLGKAVSMGFGTVKRIRTNNKVQEYDESE